MLGTFIVEVIATTIGSGLNDGIQYGYAHFGGMECSREPAVGLVTESYPFLQSSKKGRPHEYPHELHRWYRRFHHHRRPANSLKRDPPLTTSHKLSTRGGVNGRS